MATYLTFTDGDSSEPVVNDEAVPTEEEESEVSEPRKDFPETWLWNIVTTK